VSDVRTHWLSDGEVSTWNELFTGVPQSNLLQSWAYGRAKASTEGLTVRRAIIQADGQSVALVQALERRVAGLLAAVRINRGPLWLTPPEPKLLADIYQALHASARWWTGRGLLIAPELEDSPNARSMMRQLGYRRRSSPAWRSAWIDLGQPLAELRASFDGKWRNMLSAAERHGVTAVAEDSDAAFNSVVAGYQDLMTRKSFSGPDPRLLTAIRTASAGVQDTIMVLRARQGDEWLAGILVMRHGTSATYMTGWANDAGRRLRATNLLLWHAMERLAVNQVRWFDLGGIDDSLTPGVAAFKRGMSGREYALLGEYYAL